MSKRPNIVSRHEKRTERQLQAARRVRERELKKKTAAARGEKKPPPEPYILSVSRGPVEGRVPKRVKDWIARESSSQMRHYRRISREVDALEPERRKWVREFFRRIAGPRGFSVHAGTRRTIPKSEIPKRPRRPWRLVW